MAHEITKQKRVSNFSRNLRMNRSLREVGLRRKPAEGGGMDDAVAVALERRAGGALRLVMKAAAALRRIAGIGGGWHGAKLQAGVGAINGP